MAKPNIHPSYCPGCRKDLESPLDIGRNDRVHHCGGCRNYYLGAVWPGACPACGDPPGRQRFVKTLDANESVPGDLCSECQIKQDELDQAVKDGGVRFQCKECGKDGVFAGTTDFAKKVRDDLKKPAPEDVRVQINQCPECHAKHEHDGKDDAIPQDPQEGELVDLFDDNTEFAKEWDNAVDDAVAKDVASENG